jgi:hypothetical protein
MRLLATKISDPVKKKQNKTKQAEIEIFRRICLPNGEGIK